MYAREAYDDPRGSKEGEKKCYLSVHLFGYAADIF